MRSRIALGGYQVRAGIRLPVTLVVAAFTLAFWCVPFFREVLQFDRALFEQGRWWMLFTGHLTHWSGDHILWDLGTFLVLGLSVEYLFQTGRAYALMLLVSSLLIAVAVYLLLPQMDFYRGLSGLCVAQFSFLAALLYYQSRRVQDPSGRWLATLALFGLIGKIIFEVLSGQALFVDMTSTPYVVVPLAHLVGAVVGGAAGYCIRTRGDGTERA